MTSITNIIKDFIAFHRHAGMMITYCSITGVCVWVSARDHRTFQEWISDSDWSAFLLWHLQFHVWYLLYHGLNFLFLGTLRPFEQRKARKGQLGHFMNTLIFIIVVCGLDILEGFCWLHWITPFSFFRMSLIVISERLENPPLPSSSRESDITHSRNQNSTPDPKHESTRRPQVDLSSENVEKVSDENVRDCRNNIPAIEGNRVMDNELLILYLLILIIILSLWCFCGALIFQSLPLASKFMVLYEVK